ncbi:MAG TPA: phospholipid carrier-dependent glycosyltransferase [Polyangiaceae bacterium]
MNLTAESDAPAPPEARDATPAKGLQVYATFRDNVTPLGVMLGGLIAFGIYLRLNDFGYPPHLQFDEHHFVETARGYLKHQPDWNDHPPLGKLLLAAAMKQFGDTPVGFRIPSLIAGFLSIIVGAWAAARLFGSRTAALLAAALLCADGFLIAYSRAALLDGFLTLASLLTLLLVSFELSVPWGIAAGLTLGAAVSVKFSGIAVVLPFLFAIAVSKRDPKTKFSVMGACGIAAAFVYFTSYSIGLGMTDKAHGIADVVADTQRLLRHHAELTDMKNPATSGWITWMLPTRPLLLGISESQGAIRALTTLGNLATWWSAVVLFSLSVATILRHGWAKVLGEQASIAEPNHDSRGAGPVNAFVFEQGRSVMFALLLCVGFLAPWILTHRDSYIYHFLPAYAPLVVLLAGFLSWYEKHRPMHVLGFVAAVVLVAAFYAPLWSYLPMTRDAFDLRLFLRSWR